MPPMQNNSIHTLKPFLFPLIFRNDHKNITCNVIKHKTDDDENCCTKKKAVSECIGISELLNLN